MRRKGLPVDGVLLLDKPYAVTSNAALQTARKLLNAQKAGHTGTLDPLASGLLAITFGEATKFSADLLLADKTYEAKIGLGRTTTTGDLEGEFISESEVSATKADIEAVLEQFRGDIMQTPPMFSALKRDGKTLYDLARDGVSIDLEPRQVHIAELVMLSYEESTLTVRVTCSKGTYIRTLCHDIGRKLGCGGTMKSLKRTRVGTFAIDDALPLGELEKLAAEGRLEEYVIPADAMFPELPCLTIRDSFRRLLENGNSFYSNQVREELEAVDGIRVKVYDTEGRFYGIYAFSDEKGRYQPVKMFL